MEFLLPQPDLSPFAVSSGWESVLFGAASYVAIIYFILKHFC